MRIRTQEGRHVLTFASGHLPAIPVSIGVSATVSSAAERQFFVPQTMITIRDDQVATLAKTSIGKFRGKVRGFLAETFPEFSEQSADEQNAFCNAAVSQAFAHGFQAEGPILSFVLACWFIGPAISSEETILRVLNSAELDEYEKASWLDNHTVSRFPE
jgi:hypothetical protein